MFCPGCGKEYSDDRRFCSNCGTNLQLVKQAVTGNLPAQPPQLQIPDNLLPEKKRRKFKGIGFLVMGMGLIYAITMAIVSEIVKEFSWQAHHILENLIPLCALFFTAGIMIMIYGRMMYKREDTPQVIVLQPNAQPVVQPPTQEQANPFPASQALPAGEAYQSYTIPPPSVTEHTTAQLKRPEPQPVRVKR